MSTTNDIACIKEAERHARMLQDAGMELLGAIRAHLESSVPEVEATREVTAAIDELGNVEAGCEAQLSELVVSLVSRRERLEQAIDESPPQASTSVAGTGSATRPQSVKPGDAAAAAAGLIEAADAERPAHRRLSRAALVKMADGLEIPQSDLANRVLKALLAYFVKEQVAAAMMMLFGAATGPAAALIILIASSILLDTTKVMAKVLWEAEVAYQTQKVPTVVVCGDLPDLESGRELFEREFDEVHKEPEIDTWSEVFKREFAEVFQAREVVKKLGEYVFDALVSEFNPLGLELSDLFPGADLPFLDVALEVLGDVVEEYIDEVLAVLRKDREPGDSLSGQVYDQIFRALEEWMLSTLAVLREQLEPVKQAIVDLRDRVREQAPPPDTPQET